MPASHQHPAKAERLPPLPWFLRHISLLWQMRMAMTHNRVSRTGRLGQLITALVVSLPSVALGGVSYWFLSHPSVSSEIVVSQFYLNLLCFVTAMLWILWPILSAGVEDGSEKDRYQALPISDTRLLVSSVISGLLRPVGLFMFAPLIGAVFGYGVSQQAGSPLFILALLLAFIAMCATWSQLGVYWLRDVLRTRRNGESLTLALLLLVLAGMLLPPVDVGWLYEQGGGLGLQNELELAQFANVALAFSKIPPGYLGEGMLALAEGRTQGAVVELLGMVLLALLGLLGARERLRQAHHREAATEAIRDQRWDIFSGAGSVPGLLARREAFELWRNPRVRLLITVPLVLIIVLHLISANELLVHFFGKVSQIWLMAGIGLYAAALMLLTFTHNTFAYDSRGLLLLMGAPITPLQIIRSKALVHHVFTLLFGVAVSLFYWRFVVPDLSAGWWLLAAVAVPVMVPLVVVSGLWLSVLFPVKLDAALNRRERQPMLVSLLGFGSCLLGALPLVIAVHWVAGGGSVGVALAAMGVIAILFHWLQARLLVLVAGEFAQRQALILSAITRA